MTTLEEIKRLYTVRPLEPKAFNMCRVYRQSDSTYPSVNIIGYDAADNPIGCAYSAMKNDYYVYRLEWCEGNQEYNAFHIDNI